MNQILGSGTWENITAAKAFDDAGRLRSETPPGSYGAITHTYDVANRKHTITRADGGTVITTTNIDGTLSSTTGTGVVPEYHTYGLETDGRRWHRIDIGSSSSARWNKSWVDWR